MLILIVALIAAIVVTVRKAVSGPHLNGGSTFLSALRLGAPLLGLLGAAFNALMMFIGLANMGPRPFNVLAPGLAEAAFLLVLGLIVGVVAVICHWIVEARIDRLVLKA
jgi:biopolymer transport protein ExbB/TolQ